MTAAWPGKAQSEQIDTFIEEQMARHNLPGLAVAVTQGNQVNYLKGFGRAAENVPVTPQTQFFLASVSKSFTALAVMQLVEAGKIDLDAPVVRYLPEFSTLDMQGTAHVTVRHLLNHTSGMADSGFKELRLPDEKSLAGRVESLRAARMTAQPGTMYNYFNPNYEVLARIVEVTSGQPFPEYLHQHIFTPLGMVNTFGVIHSSEAQGKATHLAQGHIISYGAPVPVNEFPAFVGGSGSVISTVEDLANYLILQNGHAPRVISTQSLSTMHTPPAGIDSNYAMGWIALQENGVRTIEHNGIFSAFYAEVVLIPDQEIGIVLLYNANCLAAQVTAFPQIKKGLVALLTGQAAKTNGFTLVHFGLIMAAVTLVGLWLAVRGLSRLPQWRQKANNVPAWKLIAGITWTFVPALALAGMPWLVGAGGRFFGYAALFRSMPGIFIWLGATGLLGLRNGASRLIWQRRRTR